MASVIDKLKQEKGIPYGVNVLWDPRVSEDLAMTTGAIFVREIFTRLYAGDYGLRNRNAGKVICHQHTIRAGTIARALITERDLIQLCACRLGELKFLLDREK